MTKTSSSELSEILGPDFSKQARAFQKVKEKEKTQLKKINEEEEILNEIEYILSILDTKLDNKGYKKSFDII